MGHHITPSISDTTSQVRIPTAVWVLMAVVVAALLAIFVFIVSEGTVVTYSFLALMLLSNLFMHGGHGLHGAHTNQTNLQVDDGNGVDKNNPHAGHGGCH